MEIDIQLLSDGWNIAAVIIGGIAAGGTLSLAYMAWISIKRANKQQQNVLLYEIITWATEVKECVFAREADERLQKSPDPIQSIAVELFGLLGQFQKLEEKGRLHMVSTPMALGYELLTKMVNQLITDLYTHTQRIGEQVINLDLKAVALSAEFNQASDNAASHKRDVVDNSADKVIAEVKRIILRPT
jgi:hypothetical protein